MPEARFRLQSAWTNSLRGLHRDADGNANARMPAVVHVIPIVLIDNVNVVSLVPVVRPVVGPRINQAEPKAAVLEARESANHHVGLVIDHESVVRTKVPVVTVFRDAVAVVTAALLPRPVIRVPIL